MKSWWIRPEPGKTELERRDTAAPEPKANELLVRVRAASLNRGELIAAVGLHAKGGDAKPGGAEAAGEVAALGPGVSGWAKGDRVMGRMRGGFAEYAVLDVREAMRVPERLSWEEAASVPLVFCVVHDMLYTYGRLAAGEWLLVTGASAGVGVAALQAAKVIGARVIGTSGSPAKLERLRALGLDAGIQTRLPDFAARVREATGGGANLIVNNVGGSVFAECIRALAYEGRLATVGYVDGVMKSEIDLDALHSNRLVLFGVSNKLRSIEKRAETVRGFVRDLLPAFADGRIKPVIDRTFAFDELPAAKAFMESDAHLGKIVLRGG
jgi:NADPH:quinone reductase-like Zn-dependent oxidoreductase